MFTSAMLKMEFNDGSGAFINHFSENILLPVLISPTPINESDIIISILFYGYFLSVPSTGNPRDYTFLDDAMVLMQSTRAPSNTSQLAPYNELLMGEYRSSYNYMSHSDTVSMVCHTEQTIKDHFLLGVRNSELPDDQMARLEAASLENLPSLLQEMGFGAIGDIEFIKNPKLTITRSNLADFSAVSDKYDGTPETPFFDAFDLVKERVTRQESSLNSTGYAPAVYTDNGGDGSNDTIVFTGGYAMGIRYPDLPSQPDITLS